MGKISAAMNPVTYIIINVALVVLLWTGAVRVDNGIITQGAVVALVNYMSQILVTNETDSSPAIAYDHVSLTYSGGGDESLTDIHFTVKRGETVGIIGGTGSGKTSVVNLIPRFYDATKGTVRINGRDIKDYKVEALRDLIGVVPQKAVLFKGTIRENLLWGNENASDADIEDALRISQAKWQTGFYDRAGRQESLRRSEAETDNRACDCQETADINT